MTLLKYLVIAMDQTLIMNPPVKVRRVLIFEEVPRYIFYNEFSCGTRLKICIIWISLNKGGVGRSVFNYHIWIFRLDFLLLHMSPNNINNFISFLSVLGCWTHKCVTNVKFQYDWLQHSDGFSLQPYLVTHPYDLMDNYQSVTMEIPRLILFEEKCNLNWYFSLKSWHIVSSKHKSIICIRLNK